MDVSILTITDLQILALRVNFAKASSTTVSAIDFAPIHGMRALSLSRARAHWHEHPSRKTCPTFHFTFTEHVDAIAEPMRSYLCKEHWEAHSRFIEFDVQGVDISGCALLFLTPPRSDELSSLCAVLRDDTQLTFSRDIPMELLSALEPGKLSDAYAKFFAFSEQETLSRAALQGPSRHHPPHI